MVHLYCCHFLFFVIACYVMCLEKLKDLGAVHTCFCEKWVDLFETLNVDNLIFLFCWLGMLSHLICIANLFCYFVGINCYVLGLIW